MRNGEYKLRETSKGCDRGDKSCFRDFDVCSICMGSGCSGVGGASGEECCRELLEEGGHLCF